MSEQCQAMYVKISLRNIKIENDCVNRAQSGVAEPDTLTVLRKQKPRHHCASWSNPPAWRAAVSAGSAGPCVSGPTARQSPAAAVGSRDCRGGRPNAPPAPSSRYPPGASRGGAAGCRVRSGRGSARGSATSWKEPPFKDRQVASLLRDER